MLLDGEPVCSCLMLAADAEGHEITTVEGLGTPEKLSPLQAAFVECDALQCGFCTPGFVVAGTALLATQPDPTLDQIKDGLAGNLCRCGTYGRVFEAVQTAAKAPGRCYAARWLGHAAEQKPQGRPPSSRSRQACRARRRRSR